MKKPQQRIGAHVSAAGGASNAPLNAIKEGCETFQFFVNPPQRFAFVPPPAEQIEKFKAYCKEAGIETTYVHASYLINLASLKNTAKYGSINLLRKGLEACDALGVVGMMFHTGSATGYDNKEDAIVEAIKSIEKILDGYKGKTKLLIENAAGSGNTIGMNFEEVGQLFHGVNKKYHKQMGVCLDTQHAFASGYDWTDKKATNAAFKEFDEHIGLEHLVVVQVNDSKVECGARKDRHEHIEDGFIGRKGMENIFAHPALKKMDFCLETEPEGRARDMEILKEIRK